MNKRGRPVGSGKKYRFNGKSHTLKQWAAILDIKYQALYGRVEVRGMRTRDAFVRPLYARKTLKQHGAQA